MTQVNWNRQLGLAAALFLLGGAAFWLEYKHKPAKEAEEQQAKNVFRLKDQQIHAISLISGGSDGSTGNGAKEVQFACLDLSSQLCKAGNNAKWEIQKPMKLKADDSNVNSLVSTLTNLNSENTIHLEEETPEKKAALLKEYGLDPQSRKTDRKIRVQTDRASMVLYLGAPHPIGDTTFAVLEETPQGQSNAKLEDSTVYSIPNHLTSNFTRDLASWRDKKLFTVASHEVKAFKLQGSGPPIAGERKDSQWGLSSGKEEVSGDLEAISGLLSSATNLSAKGFGADQKDSAQAKTILQGWVPTLTLSLEKEASPSITLTLFEQKRKGAPGAKLYATVSNLDPLFEIDSGVKTRLDKSWKDLRMSRLLTSSDRFTAKRLEFSGKSVGPTSVVLVQTDGKWIRQSDKTPVSEKKVQDTLDRLTSTRIRNFFGRSAIPSGASDGVTITLGDEKDEKKRQILFWKKGDDLFAEDLHSKVKEGLALEPSLKDIIPWTPDHFNPVEPKPSASPGSPETAKK